MDKITKPQTTATTTATTTGIWIKNAGTLTKPVTQEPVIINKAEYGLVAEAPKTNPIYSTVSKQVRENEVGTLEAAFKSDNVAYNAWKWLNSPDFRPDNRFNIMDHSTKLIGYEEYIPDLVKSKSEDELMYRIKKIEEERQAREVLNDAKWYKSFGAQAVAGVLDLPTLLGFGAGALVTRGAIAANSARALATSVAADTAITTAAEIGLQQTQATRTAAESATNIIGTTLVSGALAGMGHMILKNKVNAKPIESDNIIRQAVNTPSADFTDEVSLAQPREQYGSVGAAGATRDPNARPLSQEWDPDDTRLVSAKAMNLLSSVKLGSPSVRVLQAENDTARDVVNRLVNHAFELEGHRKGKVSRNVEAAINRQYVEFSTGIKQELGNTFWEIKKLDPTMTEDTFKRRVMIEVERLSASDDRLTAALPLEATPVNQLIMKAGEKISKQITTVFDDFKALQGKDGSKVKSLLHSNMFKSSVVRENQARFVDLVSKKFFNYIDALHQIAYENYKYDPIVTRVFNERADGAVALKEINQLKERFGVTDINLLAQKWAEEIKDSIIFDRGDFNKLSKTDIYTPLSAADFVEIDSAGKNILPEWISSDIEEYANRFADTYIPRINLQREFGSYNNEDIIKPIIDEYREKATRLQERLDANEITQAQFDKLNSKLVNEQKEVERNLSLMLDNLKNVYRFSQDNLDNAIGNVTKLASASQLGSALLSSFTDLGKQIMIDGLTGPMRNSLNSFIETFRTSVLANIPLGQKLTKLKGPEYTKLKSEMDEIVWTLDDLKNNRTNSIAGIIDKYTTDGSLSRGVDWATNVAMRASGLPSWTKANKISAGYTTADKIKRVGEQLLKERSQIELPAYPKTETTVGKITDRELPTIEALTEEVRSKLTPEQIAAHERARAQAEMAGPLTKPRVKTTGGRMPDTTIERAAELDQLQPAVKPVKSKVNERDLTDLAKVGLDRDTLIKIAEQMQMHSKDKNFNIGQWDTDVAQAFKEGLSRYVDKTINTAGAGDIPDIMQTRFGRVFFQFQSFAVLNWNQFIMAGIQTRDAKFWTAVAVTAAIAAAQLEIKNRLSGAKLPEEFDAEYANMVVNEAGLLSGPALWLGKAESIFGAGVKDILSDEEREYVPSVEKSTLSFIGPAASYGENIIKTARGVGSATAQMIEDRSIDADAFDYKTVQAIRALTPGQNLWWFRESLTEMQEALANGVGINNVKERETIYDVTDITKRREQ